MNRKLALCVGINDYPGVANDLGGCVNDALDWGELLRSEGYSVFTLLDSAATHQAIVSELQRLVAEIKFADRLVFTYSGHGTWTPDRSGDEPDHRDEAMCCHDYATGGLLIDDELESIFSHQAYGSRVLVLSDSCHSGTVSRGLHTDPIEPTQPKFVSPSLLFEDLSTERAMEIEAKTAGQPRLTTSLISGCKDTEYSYDATINGRPNGAFTRTALDAYSSGITLKNWHTSIRTRLPDDFWPQSPQLSATYYRAHTRAL